MKLGVKLILGDFVMLILCQCHQKFDDAVILFSQIHQILKHIALHSVVVHPKFHRIERC